MGLLTKLKSLLGLENDGSQMRRSESGVTIEREPDESVEPDSETESAVKGVDTEESEDATESSGLHRVEEAETEGTESTEPETVETDATESEDAAEAGVSTDDVTTEPAGVDDAAEPAEATEPSTEAAEPDQTATDEPEETVEESSAEEAEATEDPVGEDEPLEDVKGIGAAYAERLRDAGVANVAELANADADQLAEETDLSEKRISSWIDRAQAR